MEGKPLIADAKGMVEWAEMKGLLEHIRDRDGKHYFRQYCSKLEEQNIDCPEWLEKLINQDDY